MALRRTIWCNLTCQSYRRWLLKSFIPVASGHSVQWPPHVPHKQRQFSQAPQPSDVARGRIQAIERGSNDVGESLAEVVHRSTDSTTEPAPDSTHVPWYLRVQQPLPELDSPLAARQRLPDLPERPPAILSPLLSHVSVELGIDDLTLLDLRPLDPPPALGANLLMVIGTARSEKHLHVSADRLCRWLRTHHGLRPYADGLLGRNELKLKMRRKAKRSKLLNAVGAKATADTEVDDGIRTGWVCVNLGRVDGGELPPNEDTLQRAEGMIGFGARSEGCHVVVQMLTEEKRGEVDLEKLWMGVLNRAKREKVDGHADNSTDVEEQQDLSDMGGSIPSTGAGSEKLHDPFAHVSSSPTSQQLRALHTSARVKQL